MILREVIRKKRSTRTDYPFNLPLIQQFDSLVFSNPVTILAGDNGSGKTTLLEGIAAASGSVLISGEYLEKDRSFSHAYDLSEELKLIWSVRTKNGFFFRASDFITYTRELANMRENARITVEEIKRRDPFSLEVLPYARTYSELRHLYGEGLDVRSHGESFLDLFQSRFKPNGLYILDEPEAPLSPNKQLAFLVIMHDMVQKGAQFIISTHSPILMAYPGATILEIQEDQLVPTLFEQVEHVRLTSDFMKDPQRYLHHLLNT